MTRLLDNFNSNYLEAFQLLRSKQASKNIQVYVEGYEDIAFWRNILQPYETSKIKFSIDLPSKDSLAKGKPKALQRSSEMDMLTRKLGKLLIICVDSDYDYLLQGHTDTSKMINENKYIFQTYSYSIENLKCYSKSLHGVCVAAVFKDDKKIDFTELLETYSKIIYELFLWSLYL